MKLTLRDKLVHLLNRYGLGATEQEIEKLTPLGLDGAIQYLVNYENIREEPFAGPYEFVFAKDGRVAMDTSRFSIHWLYRMITTKRPTEEKLTLFWHNHFAVSGSKVEFGPTMYHYLDTLRQNANGNFYTMLEAVAKTPAMLRWLDTDTSLKGKPNENFGRELMELFTLGIGNYTEKDVQAASRTFSGWGIRYPIYELGKMPEAARVRFSVEHEMPMTAFQDSPDLHDNGSKTVLGKTGLLTAEDILYMTSHSPITAKRMTKKLWEFFAYQNPEPDVIERVAKVWTDSELDIKETLVAMAHQPEFWSEKAVGTMIKSPIDFAVGSLRQAGAAEKMAAKRKEFASFDTPMDGQVFGDMYTVFRNVASQGLAPLYPPDVSGWRWGPAWVSASATLDRMRFTDFVFSFRGNDSFGHEIYTKMADDAKKMKDDQVVDLLAKAFSVKLPEEKKQILVAVVAKAGGAKSIKNPAQAATLAKKVGKFLLGSPEYQLC